MPYIIDVGTAVPGNKVSQDDVKQFVGRIFRKASFQLDWLLPIFKNTRILERHFCFGEEWFETERAFPEKNQVYLQQGVELAGKAILDALSRANVSADRIGHIFFISSTGISTPTIDAHLFNRIGFSPSVVENAHLEPGLFRRSRGYCRGGRPAQGISGQDCARGGPGAVRPDFYPRGYVQEQFRCIFTVCRRLRRSGPGRRFPSG